MATQKPISSISYNSESFLKEKLDTWVKSHIIQCYQYIKHVGEDGDKDHIHFRIEPNKKLDPMDLQEQLREFVKDNNKPLCCRPFRPSKEEDWFLYAVHDSEYLRLKYSGGDKGEKLPYKWQDIVASDNYDVEVAFVRARSHLEHTTSNIASRLRKGEDPLNLLLEGVNVFNLNAVSRALSANDYQRLQDDYSKLYGENLRLQSELSSILTALHDAGLRAVFDEEIQKYIILAAETDTNAPFS